ncbi:acyltransferase [Saccharibacillus alkalitolerans]|uniref:Acyltransferase n=1 Tax=Saccharibacillus alkalitolerans TaxID=2705290 RepID=A0ABX0F2Y0_9BACL|nr:acyltransferase [Saccharibacillus alkalitolerans]NGZ74785.1 acyltransferase [Saccharibacillus alkalitolerans]
MPDTPIPAAAGAPRAALERVDEWGLLRGLSFFAIVIQHSLGEYVYRADILYPDAAALALLYHLVRYGTLTFVFLAGAILFYRYGQSEKRYAPVLRKRIGDIYVPFAVWTLLYWISTKIASKQPLLQDGDLPILLRQFIAPTVGYHLWFVVMIFQFYLFFPLFRSSASRLGRWTGAGDTEKARFTRIGLLTLLLAAAYGWLMYLSYYRMPEWQTSGWWKTLLDYRTFEFPYYAFYFVLGGICGAHLRQWRTLVLKLLPWSTLASVAMYVWMTHDLLRSSGEQINLNYSTYLKPSSFLFVTAQIFMLYGWALLLQKHGGRLGRLLTLCGKYSFGAYLSHAMILTWISILTRHWLFPGWHVTAALLTALIVAPCALLLCAGLSRLPGGKWLTGGAGRNARSGRRNSRSAPARMPDL